jgi:hypothetical protein
VRPRVGTASFDQLPDLTRRAANSNGDISLSNAVLSHLFEDVPEARGTRTRKGFKLLASVLRQRATPRVRVDHDTAANRSNWCWKPHNDAVATAQGKRTIRRNAHERSSSLGALLV